MRTLLLSLCALCFASVATAADYGPVVVSSDGNRTYVRVNGEYHLSGANVPVPQQMPASVSASHSGDGLDEVNAKRASRGLRPFVRDAGLTQAAQACAAYRARAGQFGHVTSGGGDFQFLPPGVRADAAGCAAYPAHFGFMACCVYENYTYAGAASVMGADGKMYHHLFVRNGGAPAVGAIPARVPEYRPAGPPVSQPGCASGNCPAPVPYTRRAIWR